MARTRVKQQTSLAVTAKGLSTAGILRRVLQGGGKAPDTERTSGTILVAPRFRRSTKVAESRHRPTERRAPQKLKSLASLDVAVESASASIASFASRHPRSLAAAVCVGLAGFGAT